MRLHTTLLALALSLSMTACAKKPAPQGPQVKANATSPTDTPATGDAAKDTTPPTAEPASSNGPSRGPVPKGGAPGDPCEGGQ